MKKIIPILPILALAFCGCVATAPISVAWRSNASQQYATTEARNDGKSNDPAVNADKTTETQAAVTTSSGTADAKKAFQEESAKEDN